MEIDITSRSVNNYVLLEVTGEVDVNTAPSLREALLEQTLGENFNIIVDLSKVSFLDSTGCGVLIGAYRRIEDNDGSFIILSPQPAVSKVFEITKLVNIFDIRDSLEAALVPKTN